MKAFRVDIADARSAQKKNSGTMAPVEINGCNFFSGEYDSKPGECRSLSNTQDPAQWEEFWQDALGEEPPGPLPTGAHAIFWAEHEIGDPVALEPDKLSLEDDNLKVAWKRIRLKGQPGSSGKSRYAVLVLPQYGQQTDPRETTWQAERQCQAVVLDKLREDFIKGSAERVTLLPALRFKRKFSFMKA